MGLRPATCGTGYQASRPLSFAYDWVGNLIQESDSVRGTINYRRSIAGEKTSISNATYQNAPQNPPNLVSNVVQYKGHHDQQPAPRKQNLFERTPTDDTAHRKGRVRHSASLSFGDLRPNPCGRLVPEMSTAPCFRRFPIRERRSLNSGLRHSTPRIVSFSSSPANDIDANRSRGW
jgi:hypothetical protein